MARPDAEPPQRDDLEALFEVDHDMDDIFSAVRRGKAAETNGENTKSGEVTHGRKRKEADDDEEIKITKKRAPVAKLDDTRLLSDNGILKLQKLSKTKFKFKGKGHEFSDVARLLRIYQLWLDDLYPRAKFADGLAIIEKLGHSKRMQVQRKAWIEAGKPRGSVEDGGDVEREDEGEEVAGEHGGEVVRAASEESEDPFLLGVEQASDANGEASQGEKRDEDEPDEDELDALLAMEEDVHTTTRISARPAPQKPPSAREAAFDDEEEAMRDMDDLW